MQVVRPYPEEHLQLVWNWLHEHAQATLDDAAPESVEAVVEKYRNDGGRGSVYYAAMNGRPHPSGCIWFDPVGDAVFIGHLVFDREAGPEKGQALRHALIHLFEADARKVVWMVYSDNLMFRNFLMKRVEAKVEGVMRKQARRNGELVDVILMASFPEDLQ